MEFSKDEKVVLYTILKFKDIPIGMLGLNKLLYDCELNKEGLLILIKKIMFMEMKLQKKRIQVILL